MASDANGNPLKPAFVVHPGLTVLDNLIFYALAAKGYSAEKEIEEDDYLINIIAAYIRGERLVTDDVLDIIAVMAEIEPDYLKRLDEQYRETHDAR